MYQNEPEMLNMRHYYKYSHLRYIDDVMFRISQESSVDTIFINHCSDAVVW